MNTASPLLGVTRRDELRDELLATVDLLKRRRAGEIDQVDIADYARPKVSKYTRITLNCLRGSHHHSPYRLNQ